MILCKLGFNVNCCEWKIRISHWLLVKFSQVNYEQYTEEFYVELELKLCYKVNKLLNTQRYKRM
jgi:hypothetical protein